MVVFGLYYLALQSFELQFVGVFGLPSWSDSGFPSHCRLLLYQYCLNALERSFRFLFLFHI